MHISAFLIALAAVGVMGFANQRGSTCTVAALEEVVLKGTVKRLIALFEASLWAAAGLVLLNAAGLLASVPVNYAVGVGTILGGFLFGLGAFVNRACIFGTVARIGSGELSYLAMPLGFYLGSLATVRLPGPTQLDGRSPLVAASAWLAVLIIPLVLVRLYTHVRYLRQTGRGFLKHIWSPHVATTMIGITFAVTMAVQQNWTYSEVVSDLAHGMTSGLFAKMLLGTALLVGATAGGVTAGRFKIVKPDLASMAHHLVGGTLMGAGGLLIPGGNTRLALVGLPLLWPYAWLAFTSMCVTIYIALRLRTRSRAAVDAGRFRPRPGGLN
jgi:toxin CptA